MKKFYVALFTEKQMNTEGEFVFKIKKGAHVFTDAEAAKAVADHINFGFADAGIKSHTAMVVELEDEE